MIRDNWITQVCNFCGHIIDGSSILPECECDEAQKALEDYRIELRNDPDYEEPLTKEEFETKHPLVYKEKKTTSKGTKVCLDARKWDDGIGLCAWYPWPKDEPDEVESDSGLCWDFADYDLEPLIELLTEAKVAIEKWKEDNEKN